MSEKFDFKSSNLDSSFEIQTVQQFTKMTAAIETMSVQLSRLAKIVEGNGSPEDGLSFRFSALTKELQAIRNDLAREIAAINKRVDSIEEIFYTARKLLRTGIISTLMSALAFVGNISISWIKENFHISPKFVYFQQPDGTYLKFDMRSGKPVHYYPLPYEIANTNYLPGVQK